jgi:predicted O-methyltransferase YrrM
MSVFAKNWHRLKLLRRVLRQRGGLAQAVTLMETNARFEAGAAQNLWGSLVEADLAQLAAAIARAERHGGPIIEIGCLFGFTTQYIATHKRQDTKLITVENFSWNPFALPPWAHREFTRRTLRYCLAHCNTEIFDGSNREFYRSYDGPTPSLIFIDGDHSYHGAKEDIDWAVAKGVPVIAGHDYFAAMHPGVVRAVDEAFPDGVDVGGSVWIAEPGTAASRRRA